MAAASASLRTSPLPGGESRAVRSTAPPRAAGESATALRRAKAAARPAIAASRSAVFRTMCSVRATATSSGSNGRPASWQAVRKMSIR